MKSYIKFIFRNPQSAFVFSALLLMSTAVIITEYSRRDFSLFPLFFVGILVAFLIGSYVNYKNK